MKLYIDRYDGQQGHVGVLSLRDSKGHFVFEKLPIRSGQAGFGTTHWTPSKSPIPYSDKVHSRRLFLHLQHVNKNGEQSPISLKENGIGWFWPISDDERDTWRIEGVGGSRQYIGLHAENAFEGSAGCPVLVHETVEQEAAVMALNMYFDTLRRKGVKTIEVWVG